MKMYVMWILIVFSADSSLFRVLADAAPQAELPGVPAAVEVSAPQPELAVPEVLKTSNPSIEAQPQDDLPAIPSAIENGKLQLELSAVPAILRASEAADAVSRAESPAVPAAGVDSASQVEEPAGPMLLDTAHPELPTLLEVAADTAVEADQPSAPVAFDDTAPQAELPAVPVPVLDVAQRFDLPAGPVPLQTTHHDVCNKDGAGVCTLLSNCPSAIQDLQQSRKVKNCGEVGSESMVCCRQIANAAKTTRKPISTTAQRTPSESTKVNTPLENTDYRYFTNTRSRRQNNNKCGPVNSKLTSKKTGQKAWDKCIDWQEKYVFPCRKKNSLIDDGYTRKNRCHHHADELVKGGNDSKPYEFPHMVLVGYGKDVNTLEWQCGGSLISEKFVLTAAHCISNANRVPATYIAVGILARNQIGNRNRYKIKKSHPHPNYNPNISYNDIALLELEKAVALSEFIVPACLHTADGGVDDTMASATGWGHTEHEYRGSTSEVMQKVVLSKFNVDECVVTYDKYERKLPRGFDPYTQICYGDRNKTKDTCQGDSGGPLQIKNKKIACMYTIVGVTSLGKACVYADTEPGIYTRVFQYLNWIERIVWP